MKDVKTGIVYHDDYLLHTNDYHPECKERLEAAMDKLEKEKVLDRLELISPTQKASEEIIALVHAEPYIESVKAACEKGVRQLDMDTYITPHSFEVARLAVQGCMDAVEKVMAGELDRVFAMIRPPGHHAEADRAMGFCLFNNIAIAARVLQNQYGLKRILIVDWDVHHGNSTQHVLEDDPGVLFFSVHQSPAYPGTGSLRETGKGEGQGYTVNAPMPAGCGDEDYEALFQEVLLPIMDEYQPEILLISAGQDAYMGDPLASMNLSKQFYARMAQMLLEGAEKHAGGKMLLFLEGGYNVGDQADIIFNVLNVISHWDLPLKEDSRASKGGRGKDTIQKIKETHKNFWKALQ